MNLGRLILAAMMVAGPSATASAQDDPVRAFDPATAPGRRPGTTVRIDLVGDSTQTDVAGYGRGFCANLTAKVDCLNMARGGASTKTYRERGLWDHAMLTKPDYMVIQFGHNDYEKVDGVAGGDRQVSMAVYEANLRQYITEARAAAIKPVLVTPVTRRFWGDDGKIQSNLLAHSATMKRIAADMHVPLIDLQDESIAYLDKVGEPEGNKVAISRKDPTGKTITDDTHLNWTGSYLFGRMVAEGLARNVAELKKYVLKQPAPLPPAGVKAMKIFNGAPVKIVLVGDSTVATEGGWGPGFCALLTPNVTCIDDALNGRSSKSFIDEGAWKKSLNEKGDYYLIQFGHNDQKMIPALHTDAETTFKDYLQRYINDVQAIGAVPVLVTSLSRRTFKDGKVVEDLKEYADATREVGAKDFLTVVDLNATSTMMLNRMTQEQADQFDKGVTPDSTATGVDALPAASALDRTHLNALGQKTFGRVVADGLIRSQVELGPDVVGEPMRARPTGPRPANVSGPSQQPGSPSAARPQP